MAGFFSLYVQFSLFIGIQPGDYIEQCGLAAARLSCDYDKFAYIKPEIYPGKSAGNHPLAVVEFGDIF